MKVLAGPAAWLGWRRIESMMWLLLVPAPSPDAPYWPGRRWLSALDALAWPLAWVLLVRMLPEPTGIVLSLMSAVAAMAAVHRLRRAVWVNHRYRLTTWRWCCVVSSLLLMGWMGRLMLLP